MDLIDFLIGLTLMNAMPHFILGVWKGRMFSAFGFGETKNILYGVLNCAVSLGLFVSRYGIEQLFRNGMYILAQDLGYVFGHSLVAGKTGNSVEEKQNIERVT